MHRLLVGVALVSLWFGSIPPAFAQTPSLVSITGRALDLMGGAIVGARVTTVSASRNMAPAVSNERGEFTLTLEPGTYTVRVSADGFQEVSETLTVPLARGRSFDVVLPIAGVTETVSVTAQPGYKVPVIRSATKTATPLLDLPQSVTIVTEELIKDQVMSSMGDVMRYVPGVGVHQGENNRDQLIVRGNSTSADFFVNGVRDDVQYFRDLYNLSRVEVLKGPNALMFGRGGMGGVINRVEKSALFAPQYEVSLQGGSFGNKRFTTDLDRPVSQTVAVRLNAMFEDSDSFRANVGLERYGLTPTLTWTPGSHTKVVASYEYLYDKRVADRGITSFQGRPVDVDPSTYYGNPADSHVNAAVHLGFVTIEHQAGALTVRNHTSVANYDRSYQNFVPGAVSANQSQVTLTAYSNATDRTNVFNQTDLTWLATTGRIRHTLLVGLEVGRQLTDNFRNTGFFNNALTSVLVPYSATTIATPVTFRQSATDADNHLRANVASTYAQDQITINPHLQFVGGLRFDRFDLQYHDNRSGLDLERPDNLVSPRAGVVVKPIAAVALYGSYSVSQLPSAGDQFSSLTTITQQLQPERFTNYEVGAKWDATHALALTTAVYRLDRTNSRSTDPNDATRIIQTGSTRTNGFELGVNGTLAPKWDVAGGYAFQNAFISSPTVGTTQGAPIGQVPHHTFSLWNNYRVHPRLSAGLGIVSRSDMFVAVDRAVTLPGYARADAAAYFSLTKSARLQLNVENLFNRKYISNADSNTNISPGSPRAVKVGLTTTF